MTEEKPLFIPLKSKYYEQIKSGEKTTEFRLYGARWNENTCRVGRPVTFSKGYGKQNRINGTITSFISLSPQSARWPYLFSEAEAQDFCDCYSACETAACIGFKIDG